jgi:hypothetical protein
MKERYRYISFSQVLVKGRTTTTWHCLNNSSRELLGVIQWFGSWRQYCYFPKADTVYSKGCMEDINDFIEQLMKARAA